MQFEESWGNHLFPDLEGTPEAAHCGVTNEDIFRRMQEHSQGDLILKEDDRPYEKVIFFGVFTIRLVDRRPGRHF